ncbi:TadG family pilus assembly protein [soil metagenome]
MSARRSPKALGAGDERGAVLIFAALGLVIAILSAALAIDVGSVIWRKRDLQVVADLAAADAAQALAARPTFTSADAQLFAEDAADRNGFDFLGAGNDLVAVLGTFDATLDPAFVVTAPALADAVRVTATRQVPYNFVPGSNTVTVDAVASFGGDPRAAFSIGSKLASLDTRSSNVLGPVLTELLGVNPALTANAVTYQGLASSTVRLDDLAAELGFASVDEMLAGNVTVPELADASAQILDRDGTADASVITALTTIAARGDSNLDANVSDLIDVEQGQGDATASMGINVLDLLTSAGQRARIADGTNVLNVPLSVAIPGLVSSSLKLKLIEAPVISAFGPVGTQAKTAQVQTTLTTEIRVTTQVCLLLCVPELLLVELPIVLNAAGATGTIAAIDCAVPVPDTPVDISVATQGVTATARATARLLGIVGTDVADAQFPAIAGGTETLSFPGGADPTPMVFPSAIQSTTGSRTITTGLITDAQLSLVGLNAANLLSAIEPVTDQIDDVILNPVLDALGLSVGGADVRTLTVECPGTGGRLVQ